MKKILILYPANKFGMTDFDNVDYYQLQQICETSNNWQNNFGNKVWMQGIVSEITTSDIQYDFGYTDFLPEVINSDYFCVILPLANCFHKNWIPYLKKRAEFISQIKIPVYVIACGIQCDSQENIPEVIQQIEKPARAFIESVYATGGEFCLRGNITKEFFDQLGYSSAVVTGCPSMFQMGRDLHISNEKVSIDEFKASINGTIDLPIQKRWWNECDFIDQGFYTEMLYNPDYAKKHPLELRAIAKEIARHGYPAIKAISEQRIRLFMNAQQWMTYFVENKINFSFGSRIHGTIMPILSSVPSMIVPCDARTLEMAEFFNIPTLDSSCMQRGDKYDLYELYCQTDYTLFNQHFAERFDAFEAFLQNHDIVNHINQDNIFMKKDAENIEMPPHINQQYFNSMQNYLRRNQLIFRLLNMLYHK